MSFLVISVIVLFDNIGFEKDVTITQIINNTLAIMAQSIKFKLFCFLFYFSDCLFVFFDYLWFYFLFVVYFLVFYFS